MPGSDEFVMKSSGPMFRFGQVEFDPSNLQLAVRGEVRALEPKSFRLLAFLVENRGRVVTKEEILGAVWKETAVTDNAVTRAVAQIRKALEDDAKEPKYIETVPTVGYRFVGVLCEEAAPDPATVEVKVRSRTPLAWAAAAPSGSRHRNNGVEFTYEIRRAGQVGADAAHNVSGHRNAAHILARWKSGGVCLGRWEE